MSTDDARTASAGASKLLALLAVAPALYLCLPGSVLDGDPRPVDAGTGWLALLLLPAALVAAFARPVLLRGGTLFLVALLVAALNLVRDDATDGFAAQRTLLAWLAAGALLWTGARLRPAATLFLALLVALSLVLSLPANFDAADAFAGALGNTAATSEALLAGAVAGGAWFACSAAASGGAARALAWAGLAATLAGLLHAARAPVLSTSAACLLVFALLALVSRGATRARAALLALAALAALLAPFASRADGPQDAPPAVAADVLAGDAALDTALAPAVGLPVRLAVARAGFDLLRDDPWAGAGTGQWAARFPAVRDPAEIELSTLGRRLGADTEVEHPHDDWLAPLYEGGLLGGLPWLAFLAFATWCALRALLSSRLDNDAARLAAASALLALLAEALVRGPCFHNPPAAVAVFALLGIVLAADDGRAPLARRVVPWGLFLLLCACAPRALSFVRHGAALRSLAEQADPAVAIAAALEARPDSSLALLLEARRAKQAALAPDVQERAFERVLVPRPLSTEARLNLALLRIAARDLAGARAGFESVLAVDPRHPVAAQNLYSLCTGLGDSQGADAAWARLAGREPERAWCATLAARAALRGAPESARHEWLRLGGEYADLAPERALELAKTSDGDLKKGLEAWAHARYAEEHAAAGSWVLCLRSLRQYLRVCRAFEEPVARRVLLRVAAAQCRNGEVDAARATLDGRPAAPDELLGAPAWTGEALRAAGLAP